MEKGQSKQIMETEEQNYLKALDKLERFLELNPSLNTLNKIAPIFNKDNSQIGYKVSTLLNGLRDKGTVEQIDNPKHPLIPWYRFNKKRTLIDTKQPQNVIKQEMTEIETGILRHLNKVRSSNNVDHVLADTLKRTEYDIGQAIASLVEKDYIRDDSNTNQKNLGLRAWKITNNGERKVNEMQKITNTEKGEQIRKEKSELFNIYVHTGLFSHTKLGLSIADIKTVLEDIKNGEQNSFIDGETIIFGTLGTLKIFDVSKSKNQSNKGALKNEMEANGAWLKLTGLPLLKYFGIDVTEKFEIRKPSQKKMGVEDKITKEVISQSNNLNSSKIFISHSSLDKTKVGALIDLLEAIGVSHSQIFCSSYEGYGVALGENFLDRLKTELNSEVLVLFILSENFYKSPISLCEMGATWIKTNKHIPILIPPFDFCDVKGVFPITNGMKINDKDKLNSFKETIEKEFNLIPKTFTIWEKKRDTFISSQG